MVEVYNDRGQENGKTVGRHDTFNLIMVLKDAIQ
jgi:hypothetical protein